VELTNEDGSTDRVTMGQDTHAKIPLSLYPDGILPNIDLCSHCVSKAVSLGLLPPQEDTHKIGSTVASCPRCEQPVTYADTRIGERLQHVDRDHAEQCPTQEERRLGNSLHEGEDGYTSQESWAVLKEMLGLTPVPESEIPSPITQLQAIDSPSSLQPKIYTDISFRYIQEFTRERDSNRRPSLALILEPTPSQAERDSEVKRYYLRWTEIAGLLEEAASHIEPINYPPGNPSQFPPLSSLADQNQAHHRLEEQGREPDTDSFEQGSGILTGGLSPLWTSWVQFGDGAPRYDSETVSRAVEKISTEDIDAGSDIVIEHPHHDDFTTAARHYSQRTLDLEALGLLELYDRLGISLENSSGIVTAGFTGDLAKLLGQAGTTITYAEPHPDWASQFVDDPAINEAHQYSNDEIPAALLASTDFVTTFEGYHGLSDYNILRFSSAPQGFIFALSEETFVDMEEQTGMFGNSSPTKLKAKWRPYEEIYDLEVNYALNDGLSLWQLKPTKGAPQPTASLIDRYTYLSLARLGALVYQEETSPTDWITQMSESDLTGNILPELATPPDAKTRNKTGSGIRTPESPSQPATTNSPQAGDSNTTHTFDDPPLTEVDLSKQHNRESALAIHPLISTDTDLSESLGRIASLKGQGAALSSIPISMFQFGLIKQDMNNIQGQLK